MRVKGETLYTAVHHYKCIADYTVLVFEDHVGLKNSRKCLHVAGILSAVGHHLLICLSRQSEIGPKLSGELGKA